MSGNNKDDISNHRWLKRSSRPLLLLPFHGVGSLPSGDPPIALSTCTIGTATCK